MPQMLVAGQLVVVSRHLLASFAFLLPCLEMLGSPFLRHAPASKELMVRMAPLPVMMMMMMNDDEAVMMMMMMTMMLGRGRVGTDFLEMGSRFGRMRVSLILLALRSLPPPCCEVSPLLLSPLLFALGLPLGLGMSRYRRT